MDPAIIVAIVALALLLFVFGMYNRLVRARNHCTEAWHNIDTELKRRYDLIPNLVNCVKGYASYERALLEKITALRQECVANNGSPESQAASENKLVRALSALLVRVENYPNLKASQNYLQLQEELVNTEDRIQAARRFYNGNVRENNNLVEMFPTNLIASIGGFTRREFFEIADLRERSVPDASV
ncbi:MAG TPA: LemA family protein [Planctomycetota bacterium]|nr:LemA family protein [Planctomycetota bacterium]HRR81324.1 LemA family protein [Planctomycetota bacterium]HRT95594.1 LemA family protein [Planctomycetota bacterium]